MNSQIQPSPPSSGAPRRWVVMGVSGCGKSSIGQLLATALGAPYLEGDLYHPPENVAKMAAGIPLDDADRAGWLARLQAEIAAARAAGGALVLSCSALKRPYRDLLRGADPELAFVHLDGARALIAARMQARPNHYMPLSLLDSQLRDLQALQPDERGIRLDIGKEPQALIADILQFQGSHRTNLSPPQKETP
ncbi:gluconokinase [Janthinobacterium sp.]|uniref:gluconokinase n=1 Tax=Janthinobacterium sp. TaxID=1871054 RepID=UPI00293D9172|nr:gluconokinase [Janthinobacterium sp.]